MLSNGPHSSEDLATIKLLLENCIKLLHEDKESQVVDWSHVDTLCVCIDRLFCHRTTFLQTLFSVTRPLAPVLVHLRHHLMMMTEIMMMLIRTKGQELHLVLLEALLLYEYSLVNLILPLPLSPTFTFACSLAHSLPSFTLNYLVPISV